MRVPRSNRQLHAFVATLAARITGDPALATLSTADHDALVATITDYLTAWATAATAAATVAAKLARTIELSPPPPAGPAELSTAETNWITAKTALTTQRNTTRTLIAPILKRIP